MKKIAQAHGKAIPLRGNQIDTDRIIPARFLKAVTFDGIERGLFYDERFTAERTANKHPLNDERFAGHSMLIVNKNFGCGSSREHAVQAIKRFGITCIIGESFAEIFQSNCTSLGIITITMPEQQVFELLAEVERNPETDVRVNVMRKTVEWNGKVEAGAMTESSANALLEGSWDALSQLLENPLAIDECALQLPYLSFNSWTCLNRSEKHLVK